MNPYGTLCPGCFQEKGAPSVCPVCRYDEKGKRDPSVLPPRTLLHSDQFLIGRVLGKPGGFGITYLAYDTRLQTRVAIKEYLPREARRDSDHLTVFVRSDDQKTFDYGLKQFLDEARTLAKFDHPSVVRVKTFFEENGTGYLVMDYYDGVTLDKHLHQQGGTLPEKIAVDIMVPILDGLREVHAKGFLHRDIKPQNIYLTVDKHPILLDFGAARFAMGERSCNLSVVLTEGYAPFEQYQSRGKQGAWTDIYACAAVLYHLVTGKVPPPATDRKEHDELQDPRDFGVSEKLADTLLRGLMITAKERPGSVREFQAMLLGESAAGAMPPEPLEADFAAGLQAYEANDYATALTHFEPLAKQGHAKAQNNLGVMYDNGRGVEQNLPEAVNWHRKAADQGHVKAQYNLGRMYEIGRGVEQNLPEAVNWFRKAADQGNTRARKRLRKCLERLNNSSNNTPAQPAKIQTPATPAVSANNTPAQPSKKSRGGRGWKAVGGLIVFGLIVIGIIDKEEAKKDEARLPTPAAEATVPQPAPPSEPQPPAADLDAGVRAYAANDYATALAHFEPLAKQGNALAQYNLGTMYDLGKGLVENDAEAVGWYTKAAKQGNADAQYNLGWMYNTGRGVEKDLPEAVEWYRKAATQGHERAQYGLVVIYGGHQEGVAQDFTEVAKWLDIMANKDSAWAQSMLGILYANGQGVPQDPTKAVKWISKAAAQGDNTAEYNLGMMYEEGRGVEKSYTEAIKWYRRAAADIPGMPNGEGNTDAKQALKRLGIND